MAGRHKASDSAAQLAANITAAHIGTKLGVSNFFFGGRWGGGDTFLFLTSNPEQRRSFHLLFHSSIPEGHSH